jgi:hypothetical protein
MMPSTSKRQHNFMAAVAHNPEFAKKAGVPQSVGKDFNAADKGKKFSRGGMSDATVQGINKPKTNHGAEALFKRGGTMATKKMAKGGMTETIGPKSMSSDVEKGSNKNSKFGEHAIQKKGHTKGKQIAMKGAK